MPILLLCVPAGRPKGGSRHVAFADALALLSFRP